MPEGSGFPLGAVAALAVTACVGCCVAFARFVFVGDSKAKRDAKNDSTSSPAAVKTPAATATTNNQPQTIPPPAPKKVPAAPSNGSTPAPAMAPSPAASAKVPTPVKSAGGGAGGGGAAVLARLRQQREASAAAVKAKADAAAAELAVVFLYASQTGTAEEIAHSLYDEAIQQSMKAKVSSLDDWKFVNITPEKAPVLVVVAASTGDGDPPDNSSRTILKFKQMVATGQLKGMKFTVLGLGDSNYTKFMEIPRIVKRKVSECGAVEFYKSSEADEVDGLEDIVDAWKDGLWEPLKAALAPEAKEEKVEDDGGAAASITADLPADYTKQGKLLEANAALKGVPALRVPRVHVVLEGAAAQSSASGDDKAVGPTAAQLAHRDPSGRYSEEEPFWAKLKEARLLTQKECPKRVWHVAFDISDSGMTFSAGDAFTVHPSNSVQLVDDLLERLGEDGSQLLREVKWTDGTPDTSAPLPHLHCNHTLHHNLLWACDLTSPPSKALCVALAEYTSSPAEATTLRFLASRDGRAVYKVDIAEGRPNLLHLLRRYTTCKPPVARLLELLSPLRPRTYSLANSQAASGGTLEAAFHVVAYDTHWGGHSGVATTWLERISSSRDAAAYYPVSLRPSTGFRPPADASAPIIMVGPGTGVAPFRGFLQERRAQAVAGQTLGESWLYFGNWRRQWDYLYEEDWASFVDDGTLSHLEIAWSRENDSKVYVQHKMKRDGARLCHALMESGGYLFLCGDGAHMAKDVHAAVVSLLVEHGDLEASEAEDFLRDLAAEKRYSKDVWS